MGIVKLLVMSAMSLCVRTSGGTASFEVACDRTSHTVVRPFEPNFKYVITVKNTSNEADVITFVPEELPEGEWLVLGPSGFLYLEPGEVGYNIVVVEPQMIPSGSKFTLRIKISSTKDPGVSRTLSLTTSLLELGRDEIPMDSRIYGKVYDALTHEPVPKAEVRLYLWNPNECQFAETDPDGSYELRCVSYYYLKAIHDEYELRAPPVQYLEVRAEGYKVYYESDLKPPKGGGLRKDIYLERKKVKPRYRLSWERELSFGPWKCPTSDDWEYIAVGSGEHDPPSGPVAHEFLLLDSSGGVVYRKGTPTQLWGIDISHDGRYVAVGSMSPDGKVYLYDSVEDELHEWSVGGDVREVKFSPDGRYLGAGPVPGGSAGTFGLWEVSTCRLLWQYETSDWVREVTFSPDGSFVAVANSGGYLYLLDVESGKLLWKRFHGGYCPFVLEVSEDGSRIAVAGKSHEVRMFDKYGNLLWTYPTDQVVTDGRMSADGSRTVVGTVWGGVYCLDGDGNLLWRKERDVGHNAVYMTRNGKYVALGGPGVMLLDDRGDVLWKYDFGWADYVKVSEDGSRIVAGYSEPDVVRMYERVESELSGDFDGNGRVDFDDFFMFVKHFGASEGEPDFDLMYDLDGNGHINFDDFFSFVAEFGREEGGPTQMTVLEEVYPNPFNSSTVVRYFLGREGRVRIIVYNVLGREVRVLEDGKRAPGRYEVEWDGRDGLGRPVGSGVYLVRMEIGQHIEVRKVSLIR